MVCVLYVEEVILLIDEAGQIGTILVYDGLLRVRKLLRALFRSPKPIEE